MLEWILITSSAACGLWASKRIVGWGIGKLVLPAQSKALPVNELGFESKFFIPTQNGRLSLCAIEPELRALPEGLLWPKQYIIYFCGNLAGYHYNETLKMKFQVMANAQQATVLLFDYPHVGYSTGQIYSQAQLIEAGIAVVRYLLAQKVNPEQITCYGLSLGGVIGTYVVADMHAQKQPISLINDRSFSSLGDTVAGFLRNALFSYIAKKVLNPVFGVFNWNLNAVAAYQKIPAEYKMLICSKADEVIHYKVASLYKALRAHKRDQFVYKSPNAAHNDPLSIVKDKKNKAIIEYMTIFVDRKKKMVYVSESESESESADKADNTWDTLEKNEALENATEVASRSMKTKMH